MHALPDNRGRDPVHGGGMHIEPDLYQSWGDNTDGYIRLPGNHRQIHLVSHPTSTREGRAARALVRSRHTSTIPYQSHISFAGRVR